MTYVIAIMMMLIFRVSEMALIGTLFYCMYVHVGVGVCPDYGLCETVATIMQNVTEGFCSVNGPQPPCDLNV